MKISLLPTGILTVCPSSTPVSKQNLGDGDVYMFLRELWTTMYA